MEPAAPVTLTTSRLVLRPWRPSDAAAVFEYARDPEFFRYLTLPYVETLDDEVRFIEAQLRLDWRTRPAWAITLEDRAIGGTNLRVDHLRDVAEIGYGVGRTHWGNGYTPEAARAVMDWAFTRYPLRRFIASTDTRNVQSQRVMEKLGMARETVLLGHRSLRGERADTVIYAITRQRWQAQRRTTP